MPLPHASTEGRLGPHDARLERLRGLLGAKSACPRGPAPQTPFEGLLGGIQPRRLVDLLSGSPGCGASLVGLWLALRACQQRGELVVIDPSGAFYPPTAIAWGVDARRLLWVRPTSPKEALAAAEIALRSPAVGAVWASLDRVDGRAFRRLLLAAEAGEAFGVLVRPARHEADPSWADVQLRFDPIATPGDPDAPLGVRVTRRRNRHGPARGEAKLTLDWRTGEINDVTSRDANAPPNALPAAARLASSAQPA